MHHYIRPFHHSHHSRLDTAAPGADSFFFFKCTGPPRDLPFFPTRPSPDLGASLARDRIVAGELNNQIREVMVYLFLFFPALQALVKRKSCQLLLSHSPPQKPNMGRRK